MCVRVTVGEAVAFREMGANCRVGSCCSLEFDILKLYLKFDAINSVKVNNEAILRYKRITTYTGQALYIRDPQMQTHAEIFPLGTISKG